MAEIPTVNLQNVGLGTEEISHPPNGDVKRISQELYNAFATVGFVYIKNHGIDEEKVCINVLTVYRFNVKYVRFITPPQ